MPGILFNELPLDILLVIFEYLNHKTVVSLSLCRSLKAASDACLRLHSSVKLIARSPTPHTTFGAYVVEDFTEQIARNRLAAHSIRTVQIHFLSQHPWGQDLVSKKAQRSLERVIHFKPQSSLSTAIVSNHPRTPKWALLALLMCKNLETLTISNSDQELGWLYVAQHLQYIQWPHNCLTRLEVTWNNRLWPIIQTHLGAHRQHDLQDIWLLISAPSLKSIFLDGLEQGNNLYTGMVDQAAIRTIYWPIELEILSLYEYFHQQRSHSQDLPSLPDKSPFSHEFVHLTTLKVRNFSAPSSWLPILLCSFKSLRSLEIIIDRVVIWRHRQDFPIDFCLLGLALRQLAATLQEVRLDVSIPDTRPKWLGMAMDGHMSVGPLDELQVLDTLYLPWFSWLPCKDTDGDFCGKRRPSNIRLPPQLLMLTLSNCHLADTGLLAEFLMTAISSQESKSLERIVLQAAPGFTFRQADFAHLLDGTSGLEILFEEKDYGSKLSDFQHHITLEDV